MNAFNRVYLSHSNFERVFDEKIQKTTVEIAIDVLQWTKAFRPHNCDAVFGSFNVRAWIVRFSSRTNVCTFYSAKCVSYENPSIQRYYEDLFDKNSLRSELFGTIIMIWVVYSVFYIFCKTLIWTTNVLIKVIHD